MTIEDIRVHDPFPTCPLFDLHGGLGTVSFARVSMVAHSTYPPVGDGASSENRTRTLLARVDQETDTLHLAAGRLLPGWYCEEDETDPESRPFYMPHSFGCSMPWGIPSRLIGGDSGVAPVALEPVSSLTNFSFVDVFVNGTSMLQLLFAF